MVLRDMLVTDLPVDPRLPFGLGDVPSCRAVFSLKSGDVVLFYTDGVTEARGINGELSGPERLAELFKETADDGPLAETARRLVHAVLDHQQAQLQDDATIMLVRWEGP
jgi:serine phosphatase RsbU (regulator of sigma subunit)